MKSRKMMLTAALLGCLFTMVVPACKKAAKEYPPVPLPVEVITPPGKLKTLEYLKQISGVKTVSGQQGSSYWEPMFTVTGKYPGLWGEDFSFAPFFGGADMVSSRALLGAEAKQRWSKGEIIALMFHACPPTMGEPCKFDTNVKSKLTNEQWTELITDGTALNTAWKARLDLIAPVLLDLKNNGVEVLWRPLHEMNQAAFWWGGRPGANGSIKLYKITHDYLVKTKGLTNLIWVWNVQDFASLSSDLDTYDPGPDYYDVLALDVYWSDGTGLTTAKYNAMVNKANGKPIAIGESDVLYTSADFVAQPKWTYFMGWRELTQQKNSNDRIKGIYTAPNIVTLERMPGWN
jgi:mannan endo-1,4-beta-mannosidase